MIHKYQLPEYQSIEQILSDFKRRVLLDYKMELAEKQKGDPVILEVGTHITQEQAATVLTRLIEAEKREAQLDLISEVLVKASKSHLGQDDSYYFDVGYELLSSKDRLAQLTQVKEEKEEV